MTKILYIPFGCFIKLKTNKGPDKTEIYEDTYACANGLPTAKDAIKYMCDFSLWWFVDNMYDLSTDYKPSIEEFEIIYE